MLPSLDLDELARFGRSARKKLIGCCSARSFVSLIPTAIMESMPSRSQFSQAEELYYQALDRLAEGDAAAAAQALRRCLEVNPGMLDAMHGLIHALKEQGDLDGAVAVARRLLELDPEDPLAHTSLSILYQHKGQIAEAEAEALRAKLLGWKKQLQQQKTNP